MGKEWILNSANMRWGLNRKKQVGAISEEIRKCSPNNKGDWETSGEILRAKSRQHNLMNY